MQIHASPVSGKEERHLQQQILKARDARQEKLDTLLSPQNPLIFISLSIPGAAKEIKGTAALFEWAVKEAATHIHPAHPPIISHDILGPYALYTTTHSADEAKTAAVSIEESTGAARLLDIDIHLGNAQIDRASLNLPQRRCLLCDAAAKECIRNGRHSHSELVKAAHDLLVTFGS